MNPKKPVLGLLLGDPTGIGSEIIVKALQVEKIRDAAKWVLIGDERMFRLGEEIAGLKVPYKKIGSMHEFTPDENEIAFIDLKNVEPTSITLGTLSAHAGKVTGETITYALNLAKEKLLDGVVYGPLNKGALYRGGFEFEDDIHFFADLLNHQGMFSEINVMDDLWVTRVTSHVPLKDVAAMISQERVEATIQFSYENLIRFGIENPKIAVCALNPHAGDGGLLGKEEIDFITPAIENAKSKGWNVEGPYPADTVYLRLNKNPFHCLVGMYHDQIQTGMKLMGFHKGVTLSGGFPIVLTTPAHGTAFDIAGKGIANSGATESAMLLAAKLCHFKNTNTERYTV